MDSQSSNRLLLKIPETAEQLQLGRTTVYELINAGELRVVRVGRAVRVEAASVRELVERLSRN